MCAPATVAHLGQSRAAQVNHAQTVITVKYENQDCTGGHNAIGVG